MNENSFGGGGVLHEWLVPTHIKSNNEVFTASHYKSALKNVYKVCYNFSRFFLFWPSTFLVKNGLKIDLDIF